MLCAPESTSRHLQTLFSLSQHDPLQPLPTGHNRALSTIFQLPTLEKILRAASSFSFSFPFLIAPLSLSRSPFPLTSTSFNLSFSRSQSSCTKRRPIGGHISCHRSTQICPVLPHICKLPELVFSILLFSFAYEYVLEAQAQTYSTLTSQISHVILFHYAP